MSACISEYLTRSEAASYLGVKESTLACWATSGRYSLPYIKCGRLTKYRRSDLDRWMESRMVTHTGEALS